MTTPDPPLVPFAPALSDPPPPRFAVASLPAEAPVSAVPNPVLFLPAPPAPYSTDVPVILEKTPTPPLSPEPAPPAPPPEPAPQRLLTQPDVVMFPAPTPPANPAPLVPPEDE
jgi:hypothetical protein